MLSMPGPQTLKPLTSFDQIRPQWQELLGRSAVNNLYITPVWQELWWGLFQDGRSLAGFYLTDDAGDVTAIAPLSRAGDDYSLVGNSDTFDYNDFVVAAGAEAAFYPTLLDTISDNGGRRLELYSIGEDSPTLALLPEAARARGYHVEVAEEDVAPRIALADTWDEYLSGLSKKDRHELRRKLRRLDRLGNWRWYCVSDPSEAAGRMDTFFDLMRRSDHWPFLKRGIPALFLFTGFHPDYHRTTDTADKINFSKLENILKLVYLTVWEVGEAPRRPQLDPGVFGRLTHTGPPGD